ncbi:hypothetical protein [Peptacetobacter sp.]|uniref:hypothetical protein n=1 Tax=Peptacetobacter sp. TaxID=2991975 RepID=UPI002616BC0B|nr:hypothetical protein [Peptacetobacter sp.]
MENSLKLKIITPNSIFFDGEVESVIVRTTGGERQILRNRRPFSSEVEKGIIKVKLENKIELIHSDGGFITSEYENVTILTKSAEWEK